MPLLSEERYRQILAELVDHARAEWVDVEDVATWWWSHLDHVPPYRDLQDVTVHAVRDLVDAGAVAGDVIHEDDTWRFRPWPVTPAQATNRITAAVAALDRYPHPGELGWLTIDPTP